jgi:hypothetical protein
MIPARSYIAFDLKRTTCTYGDHVNAGCCYLPSTIPRPPIGAHPFFPLIFTDAKKLSFVVRKGKFHLYCFITIAPHFTSQHSCKHRGRRHHPKYYSSTESHLKTLQQFIFGHITVVNIEKEGIIQNIIDVHNPI